MSVCAEDTKERLAKTEDQLVLVLEQINEDMNKCVIMCVIPR